MKWDWYIKHGWKLATINSILAVLIFIGTWDMIFLHTSVFVSPTMIIDIGTILTLWFMLSVWISIPLGICGFFKSRGFSTQRLQIKVSQD